MAIPVTHLIKGSLSRELRRMIRPYPHIAILSVVRPLFRVWLWWLIATRTFRGRLRWIVLDNERTLRQLSWWCRTFGVTPVSIHELGQHYELCVDGRSVSLASVFRP
jgi:hypothetical protein